MEKYKIAVIVGSLRKESFNLKTAKAMMAMAPESLSMELLDISGLPWFNEDLQENPPRIKIGKIDHPLLCKKRTRQMA